MAGRALSDSPATTSHKRSVSDLAADLIMVEHDLRDVARQVPPRSGEHLDAALASIDDAITALHTAA